MKHTEPNLKSAHYTHLSTLRFYKFRVAGLCMTECSAAQGAIVTTRQYALRVELRRAGIIVTIVQCRCKSGFCWVPQQRVEIVCYGTTLNFDSAKISPGGGRKAVRVVTKPFGINAFELHGEVSRSAVGGGIVPVGLAAGG